MSWFTDLNLSANHFILQPSPTQLVEMALLLLLNAVVKAVNDKCAGQWTLFSRGAKPVQRDHHLADHRRDRILISTDLNKANDSY